MHQVNFILLFIHCVVVSPTSSRAHKCNSSEDSPPADVYVGGFLESVWRNVSE